MRRNEATMARMLSVGQTHKKIGACRSFPIAKAKMADCGEEMQKLHDAEIKTDIEYKVDKEETEEWCGQSRDR